MSPIEQKQVQPYLKRLFSGRLNVRNYWIGNLFLIGVLWVISMVYDSNHSGLNLLDILIIVPFYFYVISICVRRLHDLGKSGYWLLLCLIPFVSIVMAICISFFFGQPTANKYGSQPEKKVDLKLALGLV
jgi:uncharacterized membrane protein YhaH (DUF805 family)